MPSGVNLFCIFVNSPPKVWKNRYSFHFFQTIEILPWKYTRTIIPCILVLLHILTTFRFERLSFYFLSKRLYSDECMILWLAWWKMAFNLSPPLFFSVILILGIQSWFIAHMEKVVAWLCGTFIILLLCFCWHFFHGWPKWWKIGASDLKGENHFHTVETSFLQCHKNTVGMAMFQELSNWFLDLDAGFASFRHPLPSDFVATPTRWDEKSVTNLSIVKTHVFSGQNTS